MNTLVQMLHHNLSVAAVVFIWHQKVYAEPYSGNSKNWWEVVMRDP